MPASAVNGQRKNAGGGHGGASRHLHSAQFQWGPNVHGKGNIRRGVFQHPIRYHGKRPAQPFFGGLEDKFERPCHLVAILAHNFGKGKPHRHMAIVGTGVHHPLVERGVFGAGSFLDGQCVHVETHQHNRAGVGSCEQAHNPCLPHPRLHL